MIPSPAGDGNGGGGPTASPEGGTSLVELMAAALVTLIVAACALTLLVADARVEARQFGLLALEQTARVTLEMLERDLRGAGSDPSGRAFAPDPSCATGSYATPDDPAAPPPGSVAPLVVAEERRVRVKGDRGVAVRTRSDRNGDGDLEDDDEDPGGDGFLNDDDEDVEYAWTGLAPAGDRARVLYRTTRRDDPDPGCRETGAPPSGPESRLPLAEGVLGFQLRYYATGAPPHGCPPPGSPDPDAARDACDPPLSFPVPDLSAVRRVRVSLLLESSRADPARSSPGRARLALRSTVTLRNRTF